MMSERGAETFIAGQVKIIQPNICYFLPSCQPAPDTRGGVTYTRLSFSMVFSVGFVFDKFMKMFSFKKRNDIFSF